MGPSKKKREDALDLRRRTRAQIAGDLEEAERRAAEAEAEKAEEEAPASDESTPQDSPARDSEAGGGS